MTKYIDYFGDLNRESYYQLHHALRANRAAEPCDVVVRFRNRTAGRTTAFIRNSRLFSGISCFTMTFTKSYIHNCRIVYMYSDTPTEKEATLKDARDWVEQYGY